MLEREEAHTVGSLVGPKLKALAFLSATKEPAAREASQLPLSIGRNGRAAIPGRGSLAKVRPDGGISGSASLVPLLCNHKSGAAAGSNLENGPTLYNLTFISQRACDWLAKGFALFSEPIYERELNELWLSLASQLREKPCRSPACLMARSLARLLARLLARWLARSLVKEVCRRAFVAFARPPVLVSTC